MAHEFHYRRLVHWQDTDTAGIIHFTNYFRYMEEAETEFFRSLGIQKVKDPPFDTVLCPRVSASCDFIKTVAFGDELDVHLSVAKIGRTSIGYRFSFRRGEDEVAHGRLTVVCVQKDRNGEMKSVPVPERLRQVLEVREGEEGTI